MQLLSGLCRVYADPVQPTPESDSRLPWGPKLTARERMILARLSGATDLWLVGRLAAMPDEPRERALSVQGATPEIWGVVLGSALRRVELGGSSYGRVVEWCRRFGADEDVAQTHLVWLRAQPGL